MGLKKGDPVQAECVHLEVGLVKGVIVEIYKDTINPIIEVIIASGARIYACKAETAEPIEGWENDKNLRQAVEEVRSHWPMS